MTSRDVRDTEEVLKAKILKKMRDKRWERQCVAECICPECAGDLTSSSSYNLDKYCKHCDKEFPVVDGSAV